MNLRKIAGTLVMSLDLAAYAWPITIGVLVAAVWGLRALAKQRKLSTWQCLCVAASLVFPALIAPAYAVHYWADPRLHSPQTQETPLNILSAGWALFALTIVVSVSMARGFRLPLAGAASLVAWFGAGVYLVSVMAVSGVWL